MGGKSSSQGRGSPPVAVPAQSAPQPARPAPPRQAPRPQQHALGIRYVLPQNPNEEPLFFLCPKCGAECFDGNVPKKLLCACKTVLMRAESGQVSAMPGQLTVSSFTDYFGIRQQYPPSGPAPTLETLTLGIFEDSIPPAFRQRTEVAWDRLMNEELLPYFARKTRCLGLSDLLAVKDLRLKVMGASPSYGVVTIETSVQCYQTLRSDNLRKVQVGVMTPKRMTQREFERIVLPYFKNHVSTHLHQDQYMYLPEMPFIIIAAEPSSGLVCRETEVFFEERPVEPTEEIILQADFSRLPQSLHNIPPQSAQTILTQHVLRPYFDGCFRAVYQGKHLNISQMDFRVVELRKPLAFVTPETQIHLVDDGQLPQLARVGPRLVIRTTLSDGRVVFMEDPRLQLLQQLMQLSQMLEASGLQGASESTRPDVLSALPTRQLTTLPRDADANKCMICLSDYELGVEVTTLPCFHFFHSDCIREWLGRSQLCPMCKTNIEESLVGN